VDTRNSSRCSVHRATSWCTVLHGRLLLAWPVGTREGARRRAVGRRRPIGRQVLGTLCEADPDGQDFSAPRKGEQPSPVARVRERADALSPAAAAASDEAAATRLDDLVDDHEPVLRCLSCGVPLPATSAPLCVSDRLALGGMPHRGRLRVGSQCLPPSPAGMTSWSPGAARSTSVMLLCVHNILQYVYF
jgi:hypothetical protein